MVLSHPSRANTDGQSLVFSRGRHPSRPTKGLGAVAITSVGVEGAGLGLSAEWPGKNGDNSSCHGPRGSPCRLCQVPCSHYTV